MVKQSGRVSSLPEDQPAMFQSLQQDAEPARFFAVASPGMERLVADELRRLGYPPGATTGVATDYSNELDGGVEFSGDLRALYRANLFLRTSNRVVVRLGEFRAVAFYELRKKAARLPWERYLHPGQPVSLRVTCRKSRLYHSDAVAERVLGAIGDRMNQPSAAQPYEEDSAANEIQLIIVRFLHDICTISIDSSGAGLHRRGYRQAVAKAPLRETLAAGMLLAAGWDPAAPLIDPFCGSGTIAIEAAMLAKAQPPGLERKFAFMNWPDYDPTVWQKLCSSGTSISPPSQPLIYASDRDVGAIKMAQENAARAGVADFIEFKQQAFSAISPEGRGWVVTNPPYGVRVGATHDLRNLYAHLGDVLREQCPGWRYAILCNDDKLLAQLRLPEMRHLKLVNGGIPVKLVMGQLPGTGKPEES